MNITTWRFNLIGMLLCCLMVSMSAQATGYTITTGTNGSGTVTRNPSNSLYPASSTVVVTATPAAGWYFSGWSGSIGDAINPTNIFVNGNFIITGVFLPLATNTLTLVTNGSGSIALRPPGGSYASNTTVTAIATPAAGWVFTGWSGAATGAVNPLPLTLVTNLTLTGTFAQLPAFDVQPTSLTNLAGSTVTFNSDSVGTAPVSYQWYFGSAPLSGATASSLSLTNVQVAQAGNYAVVATNLYGVATSSVAVLVVTNGGGATNVVNTPTDAALRAAVVAGGWVSLACNGTITLTNAITLTKNVQLDASSVSLIVSGGGSNRIFYVPAGITLSATNLMLANGVYHPADSSTPADGGAIYNNGTVNLTGCTLTNNAVTNSQGGQVIRGGAIFNNGGSLGLYGSSLLNNYAMQPSPPGNKSLAYGGAIYTTNGTVVIVNSLLCSNLCLAAPATVSQFFSYRTNEACYGGAIFQASGSCYITNSWLITNTVSGSSTHNSSYFPASAYGGAIAVLGGSVVLNHAQLAGNLAAGGNGYHSQGGIGSGGAIWNAGNVITESSSINGNVAMAGSESISPDAMGGGIYNEGSAVINDSAIYNNQVTGANSENSSSSYNGGNAFGGGIFNAGQINATNTTIAINLTAGGNYGDGPQGSASRGNAMGGGLFNSTNGSFAGMNLTIASNRCDATGGLYILYHTELPGIMTGSQVASTNGTVSLHNTLVAYGGTNANCYGTITDLGYNMNSDGSATFNSGASYNFTDPQLAAFANNGGPTPTMALLSTSPAIGFGDSTGAPATDQRGYLRIVADGVDIGAFQYNATNASPPAIVTGPLLTYGLSGTNIQIGFTALATTSYHLQSSTNLLSGWSDLQIIGPFGANSNISLTLPAHTPASRFFRLWLP